MNKKGRAKETLRRLRKAYPDAGSALAWSDAWELTAATVLAAQCTDVRVNQVTPVLFQRWPDPAAMAEADAAEVEAVVRPTGFFRNKAKNLVAAARLIVEEFDGRVPNTMADLVRLPGVARKTANIVLSNAYGINEGLAVDTHVKRISNRLGLTRSQNPVVIEKDLTPLIPRDAWGEFNHLLVWHGRDTCKARKPDCASCLLADFCPKRGL